MSSRARAPEKKSPTSKEEEKAFFGLIVTLLALLLAAYTEHASPQHSSQATPRPPWETLTTP